MIRARREIAGIAIALSRSRQTLRIMQDMIARFGRIIRMNRKTATVATEDGMKWRVPYGALRRVVNV